MNIRTLQRGLTYRGRVKAVRQTYHVFEAQGYFFVLSFALSKARRGSGYFNVIDTNGVDYVQQRFGGTRGVTFLISVRKNLCARISLIIRQRPWRNPGMAFI